MASTLRSQVCEQERAGQGCLMSECIALGRSVPGSRLRRGPFHNDACADKSAVTAPNFPGCITK